MWPFERTRPAVALTGVGAVLSARHIPPHRLGEPHPHDWEIVAWFYDRGHDALGLQHSLTKLLEPYQGVILPPHLARGEGLARWVHTGIDGCVSVDVSRHDHRLYARWPA